MKVSVIVPVRNAESTLGRCVDSLLSQTIDVEIVLVDDGSDDGSAELIAGYAADNPGRVIALHLEGCGPSAARNAGIDAATGEYIGFADSDDAVAPAMFERLLDICEREGADMACCAKYVEYDGEIRIKENDPALKSGVVFEPASPGTLSFLIRYLSNFVWDKLFSADLIRENRVRFPEGLSYSEDFVFAFTALSHAKRVCVTDEPLYYYNVKNGGSISNVPSERWMDSFSSFRLVISGFRDRGLAEECEEAVLDSAFKSYDHRVNSFYRFGRKDIQRAYVRAAFRFFDGSVPGWRGRMKQVPGILFPGVKSNRFLMSLFIAIPNRLKAMAMAPVEKRAMERNPLADRAEGITGNGLTDGDRKNR